MYIFLMFMCWLYNGLDFSGILVSISSRTRK